MTETIRDIIDLFPRKRRPELLAEWRRRAPANVGEKINATTLNLWRHRNSIPGWAWASLVAASSIFEFEMPLTIERIVAADLASREQRRGRRESNQELRGAA